MATNWNEYRKAVDKAEEKIEPGVCDKTAPLFLELLEADFYSRKELGGEHSKLLQKVLNDKHGFNSSSHSATARHVTAMEAVLRELTTRGHFKIAGMVYTVTAQVEKTPDPAPAPTPTQPKK